MYNNPKTTTDLRKRPEILKRKSLSKQAPFIMGIHIKIFLIVNVLFLLNTLAECEWSCDAVDDEPWSYDGDTNGPNEWGDSFPKCNGDQQSPVALSSDTAEDTDSLKLNFKNYDRAVTKARIENNGNTVLVTPTDKVERSIKVQGTRFTLRSIYFHWGDSSNSGSEHTIDDTRYVMEAQFLHADSKNKFAIVAVLFKGPAKANNADLQPIVDVLSEIPYRGTKTSLKERLHLGNILPEKVNSFYRYKGSLTFPPCTEGVTWSVLKHKTFIGKKQLKEFNNLFAVTEDESSSDCRITNNFRPLQPLNDRATFEV